MATMNVPLPDPRKDRVEPQTRKGRDSNASDDVRDLIRRDQERLGAIAKLQALIDQGLSSGISTRTEDEIRRLSRKRAAARGA